MSATDGKYIIYAIQERVNGGEWRKTNRVFGNYFDSLDDAEEYVKAFREIDREREEAAEREAFCRESNRAWDTARRGIKTGMVVIAPGYWQKHPIEATYEEMSGCKEIRLIPQEASGG